MVAEIRETASALDPSERAQSGVFREILNLKENTEIRLDGMDKAIKITQEYPTVLDKAIEGIQKQIALAAEAAEKLGDERFKSVERRLNELGDRIATLSTGSKEAVASALQAARDLGNERNRSSELAITKSEAQLVEKINGIGGVLGEIRKGLEDKIAINAASIARLDNLITAMASARSGAAEQKTETHSNIGTWIAAAAAAVSVASFVLVLAHYSVPAPIPPPLIVQTPAFEAPKAP